MTRTTAEIIRDVRAVLAELEHSLGNPADTARDPTPDISPRLQQALEKPAIPLPDQTRDIQPHEVRPTHRPKDSYQPTDDPFNHDYRMDDEALWLGTGDRAQR